MNGNMSATKNYYFEEINSRETVEDYDYQYQMYCNSEIWKDIPGYDSMYQVSNLGRVKSLKFGKEKILRQSVDRLGYHCLQFCHNKTKKKFNIHQLVAMVFLNHKSDGTLNIVVDHINGNKSDNSLENLQLITQRHNTSKDRKNGSSQYVGVCYHKKYNKFNASIMINRKFIHLGYFENDADASQIYQLALINIDNYKNPKEFREFLRTIK
jgi:hypothetical protein